MLRVTVICVGKLKEKFYAQAAAEYVKRLGRYCKLELIELPEQRLPDAPAPAEIERALFREAGSYGLHPSVKSGAWVQLSMSPMTFPHHLARVMLLEQIYRGFQILEGGKYHK